jgi:hypothetical protein
LAWFIAPPVLSAFLIWLSPANASTGAACWLGVLSVQGILLGLFGRGSVIEVALVTSVLSGVVFMVLRAAPFLR